jgi:DNA-binding Lrp family transcriptional regulator
MANIDKINNRILQELENDGRVSNIELAQRVGLSPSACLRRVQELERSGVITGYRAVLNRDAVGSGFTVFAAISLSDHSRQSQRDFERVVDAAQEVKECHNITGNYEYLLRVEVADLAAYKAFHLNVLGTAPLVRGITSYIVMESPKDDRG